MNKPFRISFFSIILITILSIGALLIAHGMNIKLIKKAPTIEIIATYGGGEPIREGVVRVRLGDIDSVIFKGETDQKGFFSFQPDKPGEWVVSVDDQIGHLQKQTISLDSNFFNKNNNDSNTSRDKEGENSVLPPSPVVYLIKIGIGLLLILGITLLIKRLQRDAGKSSGSDLNKEDGKP